MSYQCRIGTKGYMNFIVTQKDISLKFVIHFLKHVNKILFSCDTVGLKNTPTKTLLGGES